MMKIPTEFEAGLQIFRYNFILQKAEIFFVAIESLAGF